MQQQQKTPQQTLSWQRQHQRQIQRQRQDSRCSKGLYTTTTLQQTLKKNTTVLFLDLYPPRTSPALPHMIVVACDSEKSETRLEETRLHWSISGQAGSDKTGRRKQGWRQATKVINLWLLCPNIRLFFCGRKCLCGKHFFMGGHFFLWDLTLGGHFFVGLLLFCWEAIKLINLWRFCYNIRLFFLWEEFSLWEAILSWEVTTFIIPRFEAISVSLSKGPCYKDWIHSHCWFHPRLIQPGSYLSWHFDTWEYNVASLNKFFRNFFRKNLVLKSYRPIVNPHFGC